MRRIENVVVSSPFTPAQLEELHALAPDANWTYYPQYEGEEETMKDADVILGNVPPEKLPCCEKLKWLQLCSAGTDGYMDFVPKDILFTNGTGAYGPAISEHLLAMLLVLKRDLLTYHCDTLAHSWEPRRTAETVEGSTVLVLGTGDLGGQFAQRVRMLGAYVIGVRRTTGEKPDFCDEIHTIDELDEQLPRADAVVMCLPNSADTQHIMDEKRIFLMKKGSVLLNVGRGISVDQDALAKALNSGHLWGAGLDVADPEPLPPEHPLWSARNILITPHISGGWKIPSVVEKVKDIILRNLKAYINEEPLINLVDPQTGYKRTSIEK